MHGIAVLLLVLAALPLHAQRRSVAVAIDDLPWARDGAFDDARLAGMAVWLVAQLRREGIPAVGFVNEGKLERGYPPLLRDAGVGGSVQIAFGIDPRGEVDPATIRVVESTNDAFAAAARDIVEAMRFVPARAKGPRVHVEMPIVFQPHL